MAHTIFLVMIPKFDQTVLKELLINTKHFLQFRRNNLILLHDFMHRQISTFLIGMYIAAANENKRDFTATEIFISRYPVHRDKMPITK